MKKAGPSEVACSVRARAPPLDYRAGVLSVTGGLSVPAVGDGARSTFAPSDLAVSVRVSRVGKIVKPKAAIKAKARSTTTKNAKCEVPPG